MLFVKGADDSVDNWQINRVPDQLQITSACQIVASHIIVLSRHVRKVGATCIQMLLLGRPPWNAGA